MPRLSSPLPLLPTPLKIAKATYHDYKRLQLNTSTGTLSAIISIQVVHAACATPGLILICDSYNQLIIVWAQKMLATNREPSSVCLGAENARQSFSGNWLIVAWAQKMLVKKSLLGCRKRPPIFPLPLCVKNKAV